jgi:hypothetical protein
VNNQKGFADQIIMLMAHVEQISEEHGLRTPIDVDVTDVKGALWAFEYDLDLKEIEVPFVPPEMPITIRIRDCEGRVVEQEFAELTVAPGWIRRVAQ